MTQTAVSKLKGNKIFAELSKETHTADPQA